MAVPNHNGLYHFKNVNYPGSPTEKYLSMHGTTVGNGKNVIITANADNGAQKWRAMYAGQNNGTPLFWLNCEIGGRKKPYALDRYTGSTLRNNADIYRAMDSSAADQLVYFVDHGSGIISIRLFSNGYALTLNGDAEGNSTPGSLTEAGNCYWSAYSGSTNQKWHCSFFSAGTDPIFERMATDFPVASYYNATNNSSYPNGVGECTWYAKGRFHEEHGVKNVCSGNAKQWMTNALANGCKRISASEITSIGSLPLKSVAVFPDQGTYGHVVFIDSVNEDYVIWSDCKGAANESNFSYSNGEIEVPNIALDYATDAILRTTRFSLFKNYFKGLGAVIYYE